MRTAFKIVVYTILLSAAASSFNSAFCETWDDVSGLAKNNDGLISAKKQLESANWSYNRAWSGFLPQISLSGSYSEHVADGADESDRTYSYGINGTQYLFKGMENYYGLRSSWANYEYTRANFKKTESDTYYDLKVAFIGLYIAQQNLDLSKKILAQLKENSRLIKLRYDSGREDKGNMMATVASEKDAEASVAAAERELELAKLRLSQLASKEIERADGELEVTVEASPDFAKLAEDSPSHIMARYQLEIADIAAQNTIGGFLPSLSLSGNYSRSGPDWPPDTSSKSWSLNLSYPIFPGGSNIADRMIKDLDLEAARRDFEAAKKDTLYNIMDAHRKAMDALDALSVKEIYFEAARERQKIADAKYLNGLVTYDEWNRITNDYISAQKNLMSSKRAVLQAIAAYKNSYGGH